MTRFDDNLWREVKRRYGSELSEVDGPLSPAPRRRLPMIAGASLGVAGVCAAAVIVLSAASSPPAFAVTTHRDGTISLVIRRIDGIPGANRRLAQLGVHVRAVQVDARCQASVAPALRNVTIASLQRRRRAGWVGGVEGGVNARIRPAQIARNHTLVIAAVPSRGQVRLVRGRAVRGAIPVCLPPVAMLQTITREVSAGSSPATCAGRCTNPPSSFSRRQPQRRRTRRRRPQPRAVRRRPPVQPPRPRRSPTRRRRRRSRARRPVRVARPTGRAPRVHRPQARTASRRRRSSRLVSPPPGVPDR